MSGFVDTNFFVRLLVQVDREAAQRCFALLQRAERGEVELVTSEAVIAQTVYVLSSPCLYGVPRQEISARFGSVLSGSRVRLVGREAVLNALELYGASNLSFIDCLCVMHARRETPPHGLYSFDRELDRVPGIRRLEP